MIFLNIFYIPLRKRVAAARLEEVKTRIGRSILDFAATVRGAFYLHQGNEQMLELRQAIVQALEDPGWYKDPIGTVALKASDDELRREGLR